MNESEILPGDPSTVVPPRRKAMFEAALAANRTPARKIRAASNALQHGLYSLRNFNHFATDPDLALEVVTNFLEQLHPITPIEHSLVQQLIHVQLRFLQTELLYNQACDLSGPDMKSTVPHIVRELDRLPGRMLRTLKALRAEASDNANLEIEPIVDQPYIPPPPDTPEESERQPDPNRFRITTQALLELFAGRFLTEEEKARYSSPSNLEETNPNQPPPSQ